MLKVLSLLLIVFGVSQQISAQCGVHFKETSRQVFSNSFANGYFEDFDNDGLNDLFGYSITEVSSSTPRSIQIHYYKRLAENSFDTTAKSTLIPNIGYYFGVAGDVNGDGKKDLVISQWTNTSSLITYLNDGTGRFSTTTPAVNSSTGWEPVWAAGDLNNDGKADVVTTNGNSLNYRLTQPDNSFGAPVVAAPLTASLQRSGYLDWFASAVIIEDLNNDGAKDIAYVSGSTLRVLTNNGNLTFTETLSTQFSEPTTKLRTYDLNNDGRKDFVSNARSVGQVKILVNSGNNTFTTSFISLPWSNNNFYDHPLTKDLHVADFDNDGDADLLFPGTQKYVVLRNQGNATFDQQEFKSLLRIDAVANLDGDGKADAVSLVRPVVDGAYQLYDGNNYYTYNLHNAVIFKRNVCNPVGQTKTIDFNADGYTDRAFWNPATGNWRYYIDNTNPNQFASFHWGAGSLGDVPVPNDYDGDGQTDIAVFRKSSGTWWIYRSSDQQTFGFNFGISEDKPVPADYDGDGRADFAVFRPSTGHWHLWLSQTNQYRAVHFGISEDKPLPADYDGDGKADINVFRPSTGSWYRLNSSDNSFFGYQYGLGTDKPVPGDYDGDGRANIAVFRDGIWYVLRNNLSTAVLYWGVANDVPFFDDSPGNRVGVFRRSSSAVHVSAIPYGFSRAGFNAQLPTGNTTGEIFVSSILPPE
ncbi:MAG TPA: VCBS repeat-containing protein [Pyrinomonadaceae bacterium]|nr:VCBS repeat-containing protein [Pyrinomonadaceae bacterium]